MSAEDLGRRLVGEVQVEGLDELLGSLRALHAVEHPIPYFGIAPLDALLQRAQEKSIISQPAQPASHHHGSDLYSSSPPRHSRPKPGPRKINPPVVEITSIGPGGGKTHLLYLIIAVAVLPSMYDGVSLNGRHGAILVFDTDGRFNVERLAQVLREYIVQCQQAHASANSKDNDTAMKTIPDEQKETLVEMSLHHVHIFGPQNFDSLLATLASLPSYLFDASAHPSIHRPIHTMILDSASAFYWQTLSASISASTSESSNKCASETTSSPYAVLVSRLRALQKTFQCPILATSWGLSSSAPVPAHQPSNDSQTIRTNLPSVWQTFVTMRLRARRTPVPLFPVGLSVEEAVKEREQRWTVVRKGRFRCWVDGKVSEGFQFTITGKGVELVKAGVDEER